MFEQNHEQHYDIVISGGGMVGAALGVALAQMNENLRVLMVEKENSNEQAPPSTFDLRSIVLSRSTVRFMYQQGWWSACSTEAVPIERVQVRSGHQFGAVDFSASEAHVAALGYVIGNRELGTRLWSLVKAQSTLCAWSNAQIGEARPTAQGWTVQVQQGVEHCTVNTRLLVIAEGAGSARLAQLGIPTTVQDYQQTAIVCGLEGVRLPAGVATEHFVGPAGSVALLPRGEGRVGVVLATDPSHAAVWKTVSDERFVQHLSDTLGIERANLGVSTERVTYPLVMTQARETIRPNLVVVGNAAQSVHPIAGQGFNLAVRDIAELCVRVRHRLHQNDHTTQPLLSLACLQAYEAQRLKDRQRIRHFCSALLDVFAQQRTSVTVMRQLGMVLFDALPSAKALLSHSILAPRTGPLTPVDRACC